MYVIHTSHIYSEFQFKKSRTWLLFLYRIYEHSCAWIIGSTSVNSVNQSRSQAVSQSEGSLKYVTKNDFSFPFKLPDSRLNGELLLIYINNTCLQTLCQNGKDLGIFFFIHNYDESTPPP